MDFKVLFDGELKAPFGGVRARRFTADCLRLQRVLLALLDRSENIFVDYLTDVGLRFVKIVG